MTLGAFSILIARKGFAFLCSLLGWLCLTGAAFIPKADFLPRESSHVSQTFALPRHNGFLLSQLMIVALHVLTMLVM